MESRPKMRTLKLKKLDNSTLAIEVPEDILVKDMRKIIELKSGIPENQQRLIYKAKLLKDELRLNEVIKEDNETVHLIKKPQPTEPEAPSGQSATGSAQNQQQPAGARFPGSGIPGMPGAMGGQMPLGNLNSLLSGMFPAAGQTTTSSSGDGSASISISMGPGGGIPNLSNLLSQMGAGGPPGQGGQQPLPPFLQNLIGGAGAPRPPAQPQPAQNQPAGAAAQNPQASGAVQLPHQVLFRIGQHVNHMHGGADFPGPPMPQLQVERNVVVLLGSYLSNLNLQLQRVQPLLSRTGDLMQRESLMTGQAERQLTQELSNQIGSALEDISRATGSVAHFYKTLQIGEAGTTQPSVNVNGYADVFKPMIEEVGSVVPGNAPAQAQAQPQPPARPVTPPIEKVDILAKLSEILQPKDMMNFMMGQYPHLQHIPQKMHQILTGIQEKNCKGSIDTLSEMLAESITSKLKTEGVQDKIHEGFDPILNIQEQLVKYGKEGIQMIYEGGEDQSFADFFASFKKISVNALGKIVEEIEEGFVDGEDDVWAFVEYNICEYNKASAPAAPAGTPPALAENMIRMKTQQQLSMIKKGHAQYKEQNRAPIPQQQQSQPVAIAAPAQASQAVVSTPSQPNQEAKPEKTAAEVQHDENMKIILQKYGGIIGSDQKRMRENEPEQNPHSRAYESSGSFAKSKELTQEEQKQQIQGFHADKNKQLSELKGETVLKEVARKNLIVGGGFPQSKVDDLFTKGVTMSPDLVSAYIEMQKAAIKFRLSEDSDFEAASKEGAPNPKEQFEYLRKL